MSNNFYYSYAEYLRKKYGQKVYKIPVSLPVSCPVRDGKLSKQRCIFCGADASGYELMDESVPIKQQITENINFISRKYSAKKYEIYFQNYTNTYLPASLFKQYVQEALNSNEDIVMLSVSTRPDCIDKRYLDILKEASEIFSVDITLELGLQSINVNTLKILSREHGMAEYISAVMEIKKYGFNICTHIITTLPWDSDEDVKEAAKLLSVLKTNSVKLHSLYIESETALAEMYERKEVSLLTVDDFVRRTANFLELLSPTISVQRLSSRVPKAVSVFSNWGRSHWVLDEMVIEELQKRGTHQGMFNDYYCNKAVKEYSQL